MHHAPLRTVARLTPAALLPAALLGLTALAPPAGAQTAFSFQDLDPISATANTPTAGATLYSQNVAPAGPLPPYKNPGTFGTTSFVGKDLYLFVVPYVAPEIDPAIDDIGLSAWDANDPTVFLGDLQGTLTGGSLNSAGTLFTGNVNWRGLNNIFTGYTGTSTMTVNLSSGLTTYAGTLARPSAAVPEPSGAWLLGLGLPLVGLAARRRRTA